MSHSTSSETALEGNSTGSGEGYHVFKGKHCNRLWQQLPPEIIRMIATNYLSDVAARNFCPQIWQTRDHWHQKSMFNILRDAQDVERLMRVCPAWSDALETHFFWHHAVNVIDPFDSLAQYAYVTPPNHGSSATPVRITPYRHFRFITNCSCFVCRINSPFNNRGLGTAKRATSNSWIGNVHMCREHRKNTFCGICLQEAPPLDCEVDFNTVGCVENEDEESWPGVDSTCRTCRNEWLWHRVSGNARDREAVGGHKWNSPDWETRQSVDAFIEMGEGTISDVVSLAQEKHWLRENTKLPDMLSQALAASRYSTREEAFGAYDSEDELSEEEEEEDPELLSLTEDAGGVRDLAIGDWARNRFLDGHWISPADQWYGNSVPGQPRTVHAIHPVPWDPDAVGGGVSPSSEDEQQPEVHPRISNVRSEVPPTYHLCEQAFLALRKQTRLILLPAMSNIVRRIVIEATADDVEPALRVSRMRLDDVMEHLRDPYTWYKGIDWLERRANVRREQRLRESQAANRELNQNSTAREDADDSSVSSKSGDSHTTSPVLSTSTLQTTPSPPPSRERKIKEEAKTRELPIPVSPVLETPVLLHPIPYIPVMTAHLPFYSLDSLKLVWREACAPLYHCRCRICERATMKENEAAGHTAASTGVPLTSPQKYTQQPVAVDTTRTQPRVKVTEILLEETDGIVEDEGEIFDEEDPEFETVVEQNPTARKRSSDEVDEDEDEVDEHDDDERSNGRARSSSIPSRGGGGYRTPPKRARMEEHRTGSESSGPTSPLPSPSLSPSRKRGSEDLDLLSEGSVTSKRSRVGRDGEEEEDEEDATMKANRRSKNDPGSSYPPRGVRLVLRTPPPPLGGGATQRSKSTDLEVGTTGETR